MKRTILHCSSLCKITPLLLLWFSPSIQAAKVWESPASGAWGDGTNWSGGLPPDSTSAVEITNANTKTVTIDATTPVTALTVSSLLIGAPQGSTNLLWLNDAGTNNPLLALNGFSVTNGGALTMSNSALSIDPSVLFIHIDGTMTVNDGLVTLGNVAPADTNNTPTTTKVGSSLSGTLVVSGGALSAGELKLGADMTNSLGVMNMSGGTFDISSMMTLGHDVGTTGIVSVVGGRLSVTNDELRVGNLGTGQFTVSNATLWLTNLAVGHDAGSAGVLTLQTGALVLISNSVSIARLNGSTGNVFVVGGQLSAAGQEIFVGKEGDGQMTLSNGTVIASDLLVAGITNTGSGSFTMLGGNLNLSHGLVVGGSSFTPGEASLSGGTITVTMPGGTAFTTVPNGTLTLNAGNLQTDNLLLTNTTGRFVFNKGMLTTGGTTVANGAPFIVGDGVSKAVLYLNGGIHSFANGLVISANATLSGCGTIIGALTNHGTIATNCTGSLQPTITAISKAGSLSTVSFTTLTGHTYTLQFTTNLAGAIWTPIPPSSNGSGSVMIMNDPAATSPTRFYRISVQ